MRSHFICNDSGERSLSESRRTVEKHMVEAVSALFRCVDIYPKSLLSLILTYVFFQSLRSETRFYSAVFKCCLSCYLPFGRHGHSFRILHFPKSSLQQFLYCNLFRIRSGFADRLQCLSVAVPKRGEGKHSFPFGAVISRLSPLFGM